MFLLLVKFFDTNLSSPLNSMRLVWWWQAYWHSVCHRHASTTFKLSTNTYQQKHALLYYALILCITGACGPWGGHFFLLPQCNADPYSCYCRFALIMCPDPFIYYIWLRLVHESYAETKLYRTMEANKLYKKTNFDSSVTTLLQAVNICQYNAHKCTQDEPTYSHIKNQLHAHTI